MEEERGEVGGGEREREVHAAAALVVLAPETRRTQRNCPGSPRWFTAARRRDKPSTAARKSAPRIRTYSDSSKLHLRFISFHFKKKTKQAQHPGKLRGGGEPAERPRVSTRRPLPLLGHGPHTGPLIELD